MHSLLICLTVKIAFIYFADEVEKGKIDGEKDSKNVGNDDVIFD